MRMERPRALRLGMSICVAGLSLAMLSLLPQFSPQGLPIPAFVGAFVYLPGAFLVFFSARGEEGRRFISMLRFVRLGFVFVFAIIVMRMVAG